MDPALSFALFTEVRGIGILQSSPFGDSKKLRFYVLFAGLLAYGFGTLDTAMLKAAPSGMGAPSLL